MGRPTVVTPWQEVALDSFTVLGGKIARQEYLISRTLSYARHARGETTYKKVQEALDGVIALLTDEDPKA